MPADAGPAAAATLKDKTAAEINTAANDTAADFVRGKIAKADALGCKVSLAVVDQSCRLIAFLMMDGARHFSIITTQRRAMASVLSQASGKSAKSARISLAGLNQCSGVTRRRSGSDRSRPSAMHRRASCASNIAGVAK